MSGSSRPRKRDQIRDLLRLSNKQVPEQTMASHIDPAVAPQSSFDATASQIPAGGPPALGQRLLEAALKKLTLQEKDVIRGHLVGEAQSISMALNQVYRAALEKKEVCESKRWRWTVDGKEIILRDEADKVVRWLDRFKSVGDVAANADPMHIGLPWAGIRVLLEVTTRFA